MMPLLTGLLQWIRMHTDNMRAFTEKIVYGHPPPNDWFRILQSFLGHGKV